jgi:hypothetical protein
MFNNGNNSFQNPSTMISLEALSAKQLLGECIDLATLLLRELVTHYVQSNNIRNPFDKVQLH